MAIVGWGVGGGWLSASSHIVAVPIGCVPIGYG